ncbi:MAG: multidrug effflux MFS transporter [Aquamicrobium sp.]|uniref:multidrug effflux MFS transporter n=1 Tax=Aquamicrobium sp. TaxID=1872579 RepID=UPI00349EAA0A|nr:multidrug effflux MFS transporter [Aquamicrobium sp.]MCO5155271.1 multidrug effflux MFS transporter [Aquamicrobium sp.]
MNVLPSRPEAAAPAMSERRVGLIGALLVAIGPVSMALFTPAMPQITHDFATTDSMVKMTVSLYFAGFALAQLVCGPLSDGFGRKPVIMAFMAIYLVASVVALVSPTIEVLILARFLQGIGGSVGVAIARAVVRDLYVGEGSARIMNLIGLILGIGPAFAPTLGGITMELFGWHAIFVLMVLFGITVALICHYALKETVARDLSRIRPRALVASYGRLFSSGYFMACGLVMAGGIGAFYTLAVVMPFILMNRIGLSPMTFGLTMLLQSGSFFAGSLTVRQTIGRFGAYRILPFGIACIVAGSLGLAVLLRVFEPTFWLVMAPVMLYAFGGAFVMPAMSTASLAPFPHMAGAASALSGFLQMGGGLVGGLFAGLFVDPVVALATVIPGLGLVTLASWLWWRSLPEPAMAGIVLAPRAGPPGP